MSAVHTEAAAIFNGLFVNEAEEKIQYVKCRPSQPYDSRTPVHFSIPGNSSQYVSLRDSYLFIKAHVEETDAFGNQLQSNNRNKRAVPDGGGGSVKEVSGIEVNNLLLEAERRWVKSQRAWHEFNTEQNAREKEKKKTEALAVDDLALASFRQYLEAKESYRNNMGEDSHIIPIDNVLHSMWNGVDVTMNGELVSTNNQKYMYKSYIETILNNSHSTKEYQLKSSGYFGDSGDRDVSFVENWNQGMDRRSSVFRGGKKVEMMGFLLSDVMGIQAAIVNGVEIGIVLHPNPDIIRLQTFAKQKYGRLVIDEIYFYVCKRTFSKEVVVAHADLMEKEEAAYPFKKADVRAYNGTKGNTEVIIENPYESKIPTRFILGMIDADSHTGNWNKNPLNFKHFDIARAAFMIDDESIAKPPYNLNPSEGEFIEPLMELYSILGKAGEDSDIGISAEDFLNGMFLLPFDVTPTSAANMEYLSKKEAGNCRIELQFRKPLPSNITIITYAIFPNELKIDAARNCRVVPV